MLELVMQRSAFFFVHSLMIVLLRLLNCQTEMEIVIDNGFIISTKSVSVNEKIFLLLRFEAVVFFCNTFPMNLNIIYIYSPMERSAMQAADLLALNRSRLRKFLEAESEDLTRVLRVYAWRAGLPADENAVGDLLDQTVVEALYHAGRYDPSRPPRAWLLGIAANLVRREQAAAARLSAREPLAADLSPDNRLLSEEVVFERLAMLNTVDAPDAADDSPEDAALRQQVQAAVGQLSPGDQLVLHLFSEGGLSGEALGRALGISPGAARVRLHRALNRLRQRLPTGMEANHD
jgi:RNA polymerase sigma-70 factor (ECF subfamily)